jgi:ENTH domain
MIYICDSSDCDEFLSDRSPALGRSWRFPWNTTMQHFGKAALRVTKNYTKGYSDTQAKVRAATSNDPWGPSGTQMNDIAQMTYNQLSYLP